MKYLKNFIFINLIVLLLVILSSLFDFRICLIFNIFKIPCPGCGISRSFISLLKGDFLGSLQYNMMLPIILVLYLTIIVWNIVDYKSKKDSFIKFTNKFKIPIIILFSILAIIQWVINLNNPLLY